MPITEEERKMLAVAHAEHLRRAPNRLARHLVLGGSGIILAFVLVAFLLYPLSDWLGRWFAVVVWLAFCLGSLWVVRLLLRDLQDLLRLWSLKRKGTREKR